MDFRLEAKSPDMKLVKVRTASTFSRLTCWPAVSCSAVLDVIRLSVLYVCILSDAAIPHIGVISRQLVNCRHKGSVPPPSLFTLRIGGAPPTNLNQDEERSASGSVSDHRSPKLKLIASNGGRETASFSFSVSRRTH